MNGNRIGSCEDIIEPRMYGPSNAILEDPWHGLLEGGGTVTVPLLEYVGNVRPPGCSKCSVWNTIEFHTDLLISICHIDLGSMCS
jgi:hypothetical protein